MKKNLKLKITLQEAYPSLAVQWHSVKNGTLTPNNVTCSSGKKVWWKCPVGDDHEWETRIAQMTIAFKKQSKTYGCPICRGLKVVLSNCLATVHPELAKQFHRTKNGQITCYSVHAGSHKRVWWQCNLESSHVWEASIKQRASGNGCPMCRGSQVVLSNCLATVHPELAEQFHPTKNGKVTSYNVHAGSHKKVWWRCLLGSDHEWQASVGNRVGGSGCPFCSGAKAAKSNCLATTHPELSSQWHKNKNSPLTPNDVTAGSGKKVYWQCHKKPDHEWAAVVSSRSSGGSCPACLNRKLAPSNRLAVTHPVISQEWHESKNQDLTPSDVTLGSQRKAWWLCLQCKREWRAAICDRTKKKSGCPHCVDQFNSRGIRRIDAWLTVNGISFIREKTFQDLKSSKHNSYLLRFDFFLNDLNILIEFDGEQHFKPQSSWGGEDKYKRLVENDRRKDLWAREKGYRLIRIRFDNEENIEDILTQNLKRWKDWLKTDKK